VKAIVETRWGRVRGHQEQNALVFRGIPFAAAPQAALRWLPPQVPPAWSGVRDTVENAAAACQNTSSLMDLTGWKPTRDPSEDCLSLNVFTPAADAGRRAVFVWIHGGGYTSGTGAQSAYDGHSLAESGDVVVVSINYRLGALGFLALESLRERANGALGNLGILDQVAALEWVRDHIAAFGGDPARVTIAGESAGASAVATLLAVPKARPLFDRAILQSGHAFNTSWPEAMLEAGERFARKADVDPRSIDDLLALPVETILAAQARFVTGNPDGAWCMAFEPCVDETVVEAMPIDAIAKGSVADKALLAGTNLDEMKLFALNDPEVASIDEARFLKRIDRILASPKTRGHDESRPLLDAYRNAMPGASLSDLWWAMESDRRMRVPTLRTLEAASLHSSHNYSYLFTWPSVAFGGLAGSCHTLEIPFVFGTHHQDWAPPLIGEGKDVETLVERIQRSWIAFTCEGSPETDDARGWIGYETGKRATGILGKDFGVEEAPLEARRRAWDAIPEVRDRFTLARIKAANPVPDARPEANA